MIHSAHIITYWHWRAFLAKKHGRWMAYEFFRQWHQDELELAQNPVYPVV